MINPNLAEILTLIGNLLPQNSHSPLDAGGNENSGGSVGNGGGNSNGTSGFSNGSSGFSVGTGAGSNGVGGHSNGAGGVSNGGVSGNNGAGGAGKGYVGGDGGGNFSDARGKNRDRQMTDEEFDELLNSIGGEGEDAPLSSFKEGGRKGEKEGEKRSFEEDFRPKEDKSPTLLDLVNAFEQIINALKSGFGENRNVVNEQPSGFDGQSGSFDGQVGGDFGQKTEQTANVESGIKRGARQNQPFEQPPKTSGSNGFGRKRILEIIDRHNKISESISSTPPTGRT